jgi:hypothetical protein
MGIGQSNYGINISVVSFPYTGDKTVFDAEILVISLLTVCKPLAFAALNKSYSIFGVSELRSRSKSRGNDLENLLR